MPQNRPRRSNPPKRDAGMTRGYVGLYTDVPVRVAIGGCPCRQVFIFLQIYTKAPETLHKITQKAL